MHDERALRLRVAPRPQPAAAIRSTSSRDPPPARGSADAKAFSTDAGKTWTPLANMKAVGGGLVGTAKPRVVLMDAAKGPLVLIGGRPYNKVWVNPDGMGGDTWLAQELPQEAQQWGSTCYNGIVALNATSGVVAWDSAGETCASWLATRTVAGGREPRTAR